MYAKVFTQILDSSLAENYHVRHMFEDLLKLCDLNGVVDMTHASIARRLKMPVKCVRLYMGELEKPDPDSRTPAHEGRRIVLLDDHRDWGWFIVNHDYYRRLASEEQRREKTRIRTEKWRKKETCDAPVTHGDAGDAIQKQKQKQMQKYIEVHRESFKKPEEPEFKLYASKIGLPETQAANWFDYYESNGWRVGKNQMKSWQASMRNWKLNYEQRTYQNSGRGAVGRPNPRNVGIIIGPTDYGKAKPRLQREREEAARRAEEATLAGQVAKAQDHPPATG